MGWMDCPTGCWGSVCDTCNDPSHDTHEPHCPSYIDGTSKPLIFPKIEPLATTDPEGFPEWRF